MDKIEAIRDKIGECDDIIIEQLAVRMSYIQEIISYKKATGIPILQPEQEKKQTDALKNKLGDNEFEEEILDCTNYQGNAVVNYTDREVPYTRIIEHKHFEMFGQDIYNCPKTVISREYSTEWKPGMEPYYPVNDKRNSGLYAQYRTLAEKEENVIFGGRLAEYKYYDMAPIVEKALSMNII